MFFVLLACGSNQQISQEPVVFDEKKISDRVLKVTSTSHPVAYLVQRIGGEQVEHSLLLDVGASADSWNPSPEQIVVLAEQDLIVSSGGGYEKWTERVSIPEEKWIDTSRGITLIKTKGETHSHGKGGEHSHAVADPYIWSDPELYLQQARHVRDALVDRQSAKKDYFDQQLSQLEVELEELGAKYKNILGQLEQVRFVSSQSSYNYIARRYNLSLHSGEFDPKVPLSAEAKKDLIHQFGHSDHGHHHSGHHHKNGHSHSHGNSKFALTVLLWNSEPTDAVKSSFPDEMQHVYIDPLVAPSQVESAKAQYDYLAQAQLNIDSWKKLLDNNTDKLNAAHSH